jgi:uncharacterized UPF0160 family protein
MMTSTNFGTDNFKNAAAEVLRNANRVMLFVHDGLFHADDVLCAVLLGTYFNYNTRIVIRRRMTIEDIEELKSLNDGITRIVCDTGCQDLVTDNLLVLDHHSTDKISYMNGVQYAAVGKFANCLRWAFPESRMASVWNDFQKTVLWPVETQDNGQNVKDLDIQLSPNLFSWINSFNCGWNEGGTAVSSYKFFETVDLATKILDRQLDRLEGLREAETLVKEAISELPDQEEVLVFDRFLPWQETVVTHNLENPNSKIKVVVFKATDGNQWNCQCVPVSLGSFDTVVKTPESWGGKTGSEISFLSGIEGAVFCHRGLWFCGWNSKDAAIEAAHKIIELYDHNKKIFVS